MKQLDPKAVWLFFLSFLPRFIVVFIVLSWIVGPITGFFLGAEFLEGDISPLGIFIPSLLFMLIVIIGGAYLWAKLSYKYYKYELTDSGFHKESGVIYKRYTTIPYDRIQNIDINRGLVARMLGLSDLQIQTAGYSAMASGYGMGVEGRLLGLSVEIAEELRNELLQRVQNSKNQGL